MRGSQILKVALVGGVWTVSRSFPEHGGTLRLAGLGAPVTVYRDTNGIPNVYAEIRRAALVAHGLTREQVDELYPPA